MSAITEPQQQAIESAYRILGEHFDSSLIVVGTASEMKTPEGESGDAIRVFWSGGYLSALGMCEMGRSVIIKATAEPERQP
jgi:hypothetical protein